MNPILSVAKIHLRSKANWLYIPFAILIFSFLVNLLIGSAVNSKEELKTGGIASIYIYLLIMGMVTIRDTFAFSVSFGVKRTDYFWGTLLHVVFVSGLSALLLNLLAILEQMTDHWSINLHFFHLPYLNDGAPWQQWLIAFSLFLHVFYTGFVVASIFRRLGKLGGTILFFIILIVPSLFSIFASVYGWWGPIFEWFMQHSAFNLALWLMAITLLYLMISYLLLRRSVI